MTVAPLPPPSGLPAWVGTALLFPPGPPPVPVLLGAPPFFPMPAPSRVGLELDALAGDALYAVLSTFMAVHVSWSFIRIAATSSWMSGVLVDLHSWTPPRLPVGGRDLARLGLQPGPDTGRILKAFEDGWIADDFPTDGHEARLKALIGG